MNDLAPLVPRSIPPGAPEFRGLRDAIGARFLPPGPPPDLLSTGSRRSRRVTPCGLLAIHDQVRLPEQPPDIGARVVSRHRMIGVTKQHLAVFDRHTGGAQTTSIGVNADRECAPLSVLPPGAVPFIVPTRLPRCANTQIGCLPLRASMIDHAASFSITTCARRDLNASGGITKMLRPISGTGASHLHSSPQTLLSRSPYSRPSAPGGPAAAGTGGPALPK